MHNICAQGLTRADDEAGARSSDVGVGARMRLAVAIALVMIACTCATGGPDKLASGAVFRDCPDCPELVVIPGGSFSMGSPVGEAGRFPSEGPQRQVRI